LEAGDSTQIDLLEKIPFTRSADKEYQLDLQFCLKEDLPWAEKGFVVSSSPVEWQNVQDWPQQPNNAAEVAIANIDSLYRIDGKEFTAEFNKNTGSLTKLTYKGDAVITKDLIPNFLRPATDNDRRGWKPQNKLKYWYNPVELVSFRTKKEHAAV